MISVIVPVYNVATYLRECLDSVLAQTYCDFEVVAVDDGSTDGSADILARYAAADRRVRVVDGDRRGVAAARNKGIDSARGDMVTFVDADDAVAPDYLMTLATSMTDGTDMACCTYTRDANRLSGNHPKDNQPKGRKVKGGSPAKCVSYGAEEFFTVTMHQTHGTNTAVWGKLFSRSLFGSDRFREGIIYEDLEILSRMILKMRRVTVVHRQLYFYRRREGSFMNAVTESRADVLDVTRGIEQMVADRPHQLRSAAADRCFSAACNIFLLTRGTPLASKYGPVAWAMMQQRRRGVLTGGGVRVKNRLGALVSYLGPRVFGMLRFL